MEIQDFGFFILGDEFIEQNSLGEGTAFGKIIPSERPQETFDIVWSRTRKNLFNRDYERGDSAESFHSIEKGLRHGPVKVLDKQFKLGDLVQIGTRQGEVVKTSFVCAALVPELGQAPSKVMLNLPARQLRPIARFTRGERVVLNGWVGVIRQVEWEARLVSSDREKCTLWFNNGIWATNSFGSAKPYIPYRGQSIILTSEYLSELEWEVKTKKSHKSIWFIVSYVKLHSITVDWIVHIPRTPAANKPDPMVTVEKLDAVAQFETRGPDGLFQSFCRYKKELHDPDVLVVNETDWPTAFINELYAENSRLQNTAAVRIMVGVDSAPKSDTSNPSKRTKATVNTDEAISQPGSPSLVQEEIADNAILDIIFIQQTVHVNWENNQVHEVLSRHLERVERIPSPSIHFRAFVLSKDMDTTPDIHCGVTQRRDPSNELTYVQWFSLNQTTNRLELMGGLEDKPNYDIFPHPQYQLIRIGAFVTRSSSCTNTKFSYGVIRGIHRNGRLEVWCETVDLKSRVLLWPSDVEVVPHLYFPNSSSICRSYKRYNKNVPSFLTQRKISNRDIVPPTQEESYKARCSTSPVIIIGGLSFQTFSILPTTEKS